MESPFSLFMKIQHGNCLVGWGFRIHRLLLGRGIRHPFNECPGYDIKQSDGEVPVMLVLLRMRSTPSLLSLPVPLWPGVVAPDRVLSMGQIELNCVLMLNWVAWNRTVLTLKLVLMLNGIVWNRTVFDILTVLMRKNNKKRKKNNTYTKLNCSD